MDLSRIYLAVWHIFFNSLSFQGCGGGTTPGTASSFGSFGGNDADQEDNVDEEIDEKSPKLKGLDEADEYGKGPFLNHVNTLGILI